MKKASVLLFVVLSMASLCLAESPDIKFTQRSTYRSDYRLNLKDMATANTGDCLVRQSDGTWAPASCGASSIPSGLITFKLSGTCGTGWTEVSALNGVMLRGTLAGNGDVGTTGGNDSITPTVNSLTAAAQVFTGTPFSGVINHTHPVNITDPGHTHSISGGATDDTSAPFPGPDAASSAATAFGGGIGTATTGVTATSSNPAGGAASITPAGTNAASAVTGTLNAFDNRPAYVKVIFCVRD